MKYTYIVLARENFWKEDCEKREEARNKLNRTALSADQTELTNCADKLRYENTLENAENKTIERR